MNELVNLIAEKKLLVDHELEQFLTTYVTKSTYELDIIRYNLFPGGKRLRPILAIMLYEMATQKIASTAFINRACALELIHVSTLILDDLPCMDNTDVRHNHPTTHKMYGEANAILMSYALATDAFAILSQPFDSVNDRHILTLTQRVAQKIGLNGLVGGQCADLTHGIHLTHCTTDEERLNYITAHKTAALFEASALVAAYLGNVDEAKKEALLSYAHHFGIAFQIYDDICDIHEDTVLTFPGVYGAEKSLSILNNHIEQACTALTVFGHSTKLLCNLAHLLLEKVRPQTA